MRFHRPVLIVLSALSHCLLDVSKGIQHVGSCISNWLRSSCVVLGSLNIMCSRGGRIVIFCRIPDSVNRRLISGRFRIRIRIFDLTLPLVYTYKKLQQIASSALFFLSSLIVNHAK